jgi:hypothetical protein
METIKALPKLPKNTINYFYSRISCYKQKTVNDSKTAVIQKGRIFRITKESLFR